VDIHQVESATREQLRELAAVVAVRVLHRRLLGAREFASQESHLMSFDDELARQARCDALDLTGTGIARRVKLRDLCDFHAK
jgi:hypothetical protein